MPDPDLSWTFEDLEVFDDAVADFIDGVAVHLIRVSYAPAAREANVRLSRHGAQTPQEIWRLRSPLLDELSDLVAARYKTDGNVQIVRSDTHWNISYGPCWYYGGNGMPLERLIREETEQMARLPEDWEPMSAEKISGMMIED